MCDVNQITASQITTSITRKCFYPSSIHFVGHSSSRCFHTIPTEPDILVLVDLTIKIAKKHLTAHALVAQMVGRGSTIPVEASGSNPSLEDFYSSLLKIHLLFQN